MKTKSYLAALLFAFAALLPAQGKFSKQDVAPVADGTISKNEYVYSEKMAGAVIYAAAKGDTLYLAIESPAAGWAAIGLDSGFMDGASLFMAYARDGKQSFNEQIGKGHFHGNAKDVQSLSKYVAEKGGATVYEFSVPLKPNMNGSTIKILAAYSGADDFVSRHMARGSTQVVLQ
jgi:hypothetical protein